MEGNSLPEDIKRGNWFYGYEIGIKQSIGDSFQVNKTIMDQEVEDFNTIIFSEIINGLLNRREKDGDNLNEQQKKQLRGETAVLTTILAPKKEKSLIVMNRIKTNNILIILVDGVVVRRYIKNGCSGKTKNPILSADIRFYNVFDTLVRSEQVKNLVTIAATRVATIFVDKIFNWLRK